MGPYQALEWELQEEQVGRLLVALDLTESNGARLVALLCAIGSGSCLSNCAIVSWDAQA